MVRTVFGIDLSFSFVQLSEQISYGRIRGRGRGRETAKSKIYRYGYGMGFSSHGSHLPLI
ncbi:unnamed protein product [Brassica oleracea]